jgi:hypothetical protein
MAASGRRDARCSKADAGIFSGLLISIGLRFLLQPPLKGRFFLYLFLEILKHVGRYYF